MDISAALPLLDETILATTRYLAALTELTDEQAREPSLLPGWSRGHVVSHLARNADALTHAVHQVLNDEDAWMYSSQDDRNAQVEAGAGRSAVELREDSAASCGRLLQALNELHPRHLDVPVSRLPGGERFFTVGDLPGTRLTELEVHHADLGLGYGPADWAVGFAVSLVGRRQQEIGLDGPSMVLRATDTDDVWKTGEGAGPEIRGTAGALAWWLVGRGDGAGLDSSTGELPRLGRWR